MARIQPGSLRHLYSDTTTSSTTMAPLTPESTNSVTSSRATNNWLDVQRSGIGPSRLVRANLRALTVVVGPVRASVAVMSLGWRGWTK
jgi:hypothetical protein